MTASSYFYAMLYSLMMIWQRVVAVAAVMAAISLTVSVSVAVASLLPSLAEKYTHCQFGVAPLNWKCCLARGCRCLSVCLSLIVSLNFYLSDCLYLLCVCMCECV